MSLKSVVSGHYSRGMLLHRLHEALLAEGVDPEHPNLESLAPYDHFHTRGLEATEELANSLAVAATHHVLDIGSGIGGPARYFATRFACRVTGIDLTAEFCQVARALTAALGLQDSVAFVQGNALQLPFTTGVFDGAYAMSISMNIADRVSLYREIYRVLKPGAWLVISEMAQGPAGSPDYPTPWATMAETSFLVAPSQTQHELKATGFIIHKVRHTAEQALKFADLSRASIERGEKPPNRAVQLVHGDRATEMAANSTRGIARATLIPSEFMCRKPA